MLGPTWHEVKFEVKLRNQMEKIMKWKPSGNGWGDKLGVKIST